MQIFKSTYSYQNKHIEEQKPEKNQTNQTITQKFIHHHSLLFFFWKKFPVFFYVEKEESFKDSSNNKLPKY